jgi:glycosyltransferase involved in cell wall biosynthesis
MRVLFLTSGPTVPSTRFRILQFVPLLEAEGHECVVAHSWPDKYEQSPWLGFRLSQRARRWKRRLDAIRARRGRFDVIVIERELFNDATFDLELEFRRLAPRLVLDIDDGVFLKWPEKIARVAGAADCVIAGSDLLAEALAQFSQRVTIIPTCLDVGRYAVKEHVSRSRPVIGWTGTSSNLGYFEQVDPALTELAARMPYSLAIIADERAGRRLPRVSGVETRFIQWAIETEAASLLEFDVGIMPLPEDDWSRFKCGFKLIQYMAAGLPTVASPVGVNPQIVNPGVTGVLTETRAEWADAMAGLLGDVEGRRQMGAAGRRRVEERYSIQANWERWRQAVLGPGR